MSLMEALMAGLFSELLSVDVTAPFERMAYAEAMERFGSDKPDLRIALELVTISDLLTDVEFKVFSGPALDETGRVAALRVPGGNKLTRKEIDDYTSYVGRYGAKGLAYIKCNDVAAGRDGLQSMIYHRGVKVCSHPFSNSCRTRQSAAFSSAPEPRPVT